MLFTQNTELRVMSCPHNKEILVHKVGVLSRYYCMECGVQLPNYRPEAKQVRLQCASHPKVQRDTTEVKQPVSFILHPPHKPSAKVVCPKCRAENTVFKSDVLAKIGLIAHFCRACGFRVKPPKGQPHSLLTMKSTVVGTPPTDFSTKTVAPVSKLALNHVQQPKKPASRTYSGIGFTIKSE